MRRLRYRLVLSVLMGVLSLVPLAQQASAMGGAFSWVSRNTSGTNLNDTSNGAGALSQGISDNGRYVLFTTLATDAVANDTNGYRDVFRYDRQTNTTELVSIGTSGQQGNNDSGFGNEVAMSGDGRYVAFATNATNLVSNDYNNATDILVRDMQSGITKRVCGSTYNGPFCTAVSMSRDGRYITYALSDPFAYYSQRQVFRYDQTTGGSELVSASSTGDPGNGGSFWTRVSADGRYVAFDSYATNLVPNDTNGQQDIFRKDMQTGDIVLVSATATTQANQYSQWSSISDDGRYVAFTSSATNLVSGTTGNIGRMFVKDIDQNTMQVVGGTTVGSGYGVMTGNGSAVVYLTSAQVSSTDTDTAQDIYVWNRTTGANTRISEQADGTTWGIYGFGLGGVSQDARYISMTTNNNVDANDQGSAQDAYVYDAGPAAPTNLTAPSPTKNKPALSWNAVPGASSYNVYRNGTVVGTTSGTTFTDTVATEGSIAYKVTAVDSGVEGAPSNEITVVYDVTRPTMSFTAPTSFTGPFATGPTVTVAASDSGSGLNNMAIHVYTSAGQLLTTCGSATPAQLAAGSMSCSLSSLPSGTYNVRAGSFDNAGNNRTINSGNFVIQ